MRSCSRHRDRNGGASDGAAGGGGGATWNLGPGGCLRYLTGGI